MNEDNRNARPEATASLVEVLDAAATRRRAEADGEQSGASINVTELAADDPLAQLLHRASDVPQRPGESS